MKGLLGEKLGMTQVWDENNRVVPVTVVKAGPCVVTQVKTPEQDGYSSVQIAFGAIDPRKVNKPAIGPLRQGGRHAAPPPGRAAHRDASEYTARARSSPSTRSRPVRSIDVVGTTKGKGYAGVMKRHGFHGVERLARCAPQPPQAGLDRRLRDPRPCLQGHAHGGPHGRRRARPPRTSPSTRSTPRTACILIKGAVPGPKGGLVLVRTAAKGA